MRGEDKKPIQELSAAAYIAAISSLLGKLKGYDKQSDKEAILSAARKIFFHGVETLVYREAAKSGEESLFLDSLIVVFSF